MLKEYIFTIFTLVAVFSFGSFVAFSKGNVSDWLDFISAFSGLGLLGLSVYALFYWRKQEKYKNRSEIASIISKALARPTWQLELSIARYRISEFSSKSDKKAMTLDVKKALLTELTTLGDTLKDDIAHLAPFISDEFNDTCMNWVFELATKPKDDTLINYCTDVIEKFRKMRQQLIRIASFETTTLECKQIKPRTVSYNIHKGLLENKPKAETRSSI